MVVVTSAEAMVVVTSAGTMVVVTSVRTMVAVISVVTSVVVTSVGGLLSTKKLGSVRPPSWKAPTLVAMYRTTIR